MIFGAEHLFIQPILKFKHYIIPYHCINNNNNSDQYVQFYDTFTIILIQVRYIKLVFSYML